MGSKTGRVGLFLRIVPSVDCSHTIPVQSLKALKVKGYDTSEFLFRRRDGGTAPNPMGNADWRPALEWVGWADFRGERI